MDNATWLSTRPSLQSPGLSSIAGVDVTSSYKRQGAFRQGPATSPTSLLTPQGQVFNADGKRRRLGHETHHLRVRGGDVANANTKMAGIPIFVAMATSMYHELSPQFVGGVLTSGLHIANRFKSNSDIVPIQKLQAYLFNEPKPATGERHLTVKELLQDIPPLGIAINAEADDNLLPTDRASVDPQELHFSTGKVAEIASFFGHRVLMGQTIGFIARRGMSREEAINAGLNYFAAYSGDTPLEIKFDKDACDYPVMLEPYVGWGAPTLMQRMFKNPDGEGNHFGAFLSCGIFDHSKEGSSMNYQRAIGDAYEATKIGKTVFHQQVLAWEF